jgi:protein-disulfide isomerase
VRIVFKALPMFGAQSMPVAEAAVCAHAQGRFWAYHDAAIKPGLLDAARLAALSAEAGLERERFNACLQDGALKAQANGALDEAGRYGITRGPTVVVNGRIAPEAPAFLPPFEYLTRLIEEALQRQSRAGVKGER